MKKVVVFLALLLASSFAAFAGGPLVVDTDGNPVGWDTTTRVLYRTDQGNLGLLSSASAVASVRTFFGTWQDVPTATICFRRAGSTTVDVDVTNFGPYLGPYGGGTEPLGESAIVFDADGAIFDLLYGVGTGVVGFAAPTWFSDGAVTVAIGDPVPPGSKTIEGLSFLNGKFLDGIDDPAHGNYELPEEVFDTIFVHEFGHFAGLDHTQIHGLMGPPESDVPDHTQPVETMFPYLVDSGQLTLERDDVVALSSLYPTKGFRKTTGRITGRITAEDGTLFSGANVVARNIDDDSDAVSYVSGANVVGAGLYTIAGLTPGRRYRVEIQQIDPFHSGGSSVGPYSSPVILPGPPELFNGAAESADPAIDDSASYVPIVAAAGATRRNVNIVMNRQPFTVRNVTLNEPNGQLQDFAIGDFDRDGVLDFVAVQSGFTPGNLTRFFRGLGGGEFAPPVLIANDPGNEFVEAGQFNPANDGFLDIVVGNSSFGTVRFYAGDGTGGFASPTTIFTDPDASFMRSLATGDLDGDPYPDLVCLMENSDGGGTAYSMLGRAAGAFHVVETEFAPGSGFPQRDLTVAQVMGSAHRDAIGTLWDLEGQALGILVGDGAGGFTLAPRFPLAPISIMTGVNLEVADLDGDGNTDVVLNDQHPVGGPPNWTRSWMDVLLGDGNGAFTLLTRYWVPDPGQSGIVLADLDRDGHLDIATSGGYGLPGSPGAKIHVVFGDGQGGFGEVTSIWGLAESPESMFAADFDGDGRLDLLLSTSETAHEGPLYQGNYSVLMNRLAREVD